MLLPPKQWLFKHTGKFYAAAVKRTFKKLGINNPGKSFDLIHAHVALPDGDAARRLAQVWGIPYVVTIHGQDFYDTIKRSAEEENVVARVLAKSAKVIMVSTKLREIAEREMLPGLEKTVIVPNGVSLNKIYRGISPIAKQYQGKTVLLSVGNLIPRKAHDYVLQALKNLVKKYPSLHYIIVGDGQERECLLQRTIDLGLENRVDFVGRVEHARALEYMSFCDIFVLPSWAEAFGVVYIEAMAHGKPIIGCYGEGVEDIVEENISGKLVPEKNPEALFNRISELMDPDYRKQMGEAGRKVVETRFTWDANAQHMLDIYREIVFE
jgi:glycosyltransferase involved in cell wall biosynthesis